MYKQTRNRPYMMLYITRLRHCKIEECLCIDQLSLGDIVGLPESAHFFFFLWPWHHITQLNLIFLCCLFFLYLGPNRAPDSSSDSCPVTWGHVRWLEVSHYTRRNVLVFNTEIVAVLIATKCSYSYLWWCIHAKKWFIREK